MSSIDESIAQVRAQLPDEALSKVGAVLEGIKAEVKELQDSLSAANNESKSRKIKLREYESKLEDYEVKASELQKKIDGFDSTPLKQEAEKYKTKYEKMLTSQKNQFISAFPCRIYIDSAHEYLTRIFFSSCLRLFCLLSSFLIPDS